jgi:hypothetical protein
MSRPILTPPPPVDLLVGSLPLQLATGGVVFPNASAAYLYSFQVSRPLTVTNTYCRITVQSGNIDFGIYRYDSATLATRLGSTGATACPAAAATVTIALTASVSLLPGVGYYAALAADNGTVAIAAAGNFGAPFVPGYAGSKVQVATSYPLPATINPGSTGTQAIYGLWFA